MSGRAGRWEGSKTLMGGSAEWQRQLDDNEAEAARCNFTPVFHTPNK